MARAIEEQVLRKVEAIGERVMDYVREGTGETFGLAFVPLVERPPVERPLASDQEERGRHQAVVGQVQTRR